MLVREVIGSIAKIAISKILKKKKNPISTLDGAKPKKYI